jgi:ectoine hydroxylase-related dioxygenase (phytanoyl-CoA dioxygenase family)
MGRLSQAAVDRFRRDGYLVVEHGVTPAQLAALNAQLDAWVEESRAHTTNYGRTLDGKARFDLEPAHTAAVPRLRRVANPIEISAAYRDALMTAPFVDMLEDLIGPDIKFHHCKVNVKLAYSEQRVGWHQDHPYDPHTNDDVVVALVMLTDMTLDNGCLLVVPGSHTERYSLYRGDRYVGEIAPEHLPGIARRAVPVTGEAGSVCLQHTWLVHGSGPNRTDRARALLICDYTAADAFPLTPPAVPSSLTGTIVRGRATRVARLKEARLELPAPYEHDSFFALQGEAAATDVRAAEASPMGRKTPG